MGSEMCIRDSYYAVVKNDRGAAATYYKLSIAGKLVSFPFQAAEACLLYTSDAADERSSVDLGGRRIIKKKKHTIVRLADRLTRTTREQ